MKTLQGQFLVAAPKLTDPNFFRSVVLMVQHNDEGALGLIVNRPLDTSVQKAWEQVSEDACEVEGYLHQGGPCDGPLMVVHTDEDLGQIEVMPGVHFSTEKDVVEELVTKGDDDLRIKFFVGYAGWAPGQLERELSEGSWQVTSATAEQVFQADAGEDQWTALRREIARATSFPWIDPKRIPPDPTVN